MVEEKKENKKLNSLLKELDSGDEAQQLKALKGLKLNGDIEAIEYLIFHLTNSKSDKVKSEITEMLSSLKLSKAPDVIAKCLIKEEYMAVRATLLNTIWNSGLDYRTHLNTIVNIAIDGEMIEALECMTILENTNGPFEEEDILEPLLSAQQYLSNTTEESAKNEIIKEIAEYLARINDSL